MLKVNIYFVLSLKQKQVVPLRKGKKLPIFCYKYFHVKNVIFLPFLAKKNCKGWPDNFETFHKEKSGVLENKP